MLALVLSIFYIIITSRTTVYLPFTSFHEFYHFGCENFIDFHAEHFCPVWNKKKQTKEKRQYFRREPINASQEEFLRSPVAPVDVFHQDCHEINKPNLSAQWDRWLHMLTVCPLSQSFQYRTVSPLYDEEQRLQQLCGRTRYKMRFFLFF